MEGGGKARHNALQSRRVGGCARLSPLDVRCAFIKNQYRSVLIGSSLPREGEGVRGGRCVGVRCRRNKRELI